MAAAKLFNLARMTTATTGTGTITLGSAVSSFLSFAQAGAADGDTVTYAIEDGENREIGRGVYTAAGATLTRSVLKSTNADAAINLFGSAQVFITAAKEDFPIAAAGTPNYLPKWDGNSALTQASLIYDSGSQVGINNAAPTAGKLDISANSGGVPDGSDSMLRIALANGASAVGCRIDSFAAFGLFAFYRANTSGQAPSALSSSNVIGGFGWRGYGATGYTANTGRITGIATENWSDTAQGSAIALETTPNGSTTASRVERLRIDQDGTLLHRAQATAIVDANSHLGLRSYTVGSLPSASTAARLIYVSDGTSNKRLAVSDGTNWRFPDGNVVS